MKKQILFALVALLLALPSAQAAKKDAPLYFPPTKGQWEKIDPGLQKGLFKKEGGRIGLKEGGNGKWIQKATKGMVKTKPCTGKKFGSKSCPPGSRRYNLAKTFKKMGRERKAEG